MVIHLAVQRAFEIIRGRSALSLATLHEDDVTRILRGVLSNDLWQTGEVPGFNKNTFTHIGRQHRCVSYNGDHLAKEPDMRFELRDDNRMNVLSTEDGIVVECKPIDAKHPPSSHYCTKGILRFVKGEYAWAMPEALMIGYVRGQRSITKTLIPYMRRKAQITSLATIEEVKPIGTASKSCEPLSKSRHNRPFTWLHGHGSASPITVYHSWHICE